MKFKKRTHTCGELNLSFLNQKVVLNGWASKIRDLGGLLFIDLRDRYGITQLKINPSNTALYRLALKIKTEFVISAEGVVIERESRNKNLPTGDIEIETENIEILNESLVTPFVIENEVKASEELRLKYRYLDLRRQPMANNLLVRNDIYNAVHRYYRSLNFIEVETPVLMKSTPEGARDYLVPSRTHRGKFYALPQSPQTYKQILMIAGLDRYVQICKCFRDEDLRADRQPEFTQIDVEMSFVEQEEIFSVSEGLFYKIWKEIKNVDIKIPFNRLTYDESISIYGTDKPDFRIKDKMIIKDITEIVTNSGFKIFSDAAKTGIVAGIKIDSQTEKRKFEFTRKFIDKYTEFVKSCGMSGLVYFKINEDSKIQSPASKFLDEVTINDIVKHFSAENGDLILILAGNKTLSLNTLGQLRIKIAEELNLLDDNAYEFVWITDFPLFKYEESENKYYGEHHIFTSPKQEHLHLLGSKNKTELESIRADCYDLVLNGNEIGSGSIRIHDSRIQKKIFDIIGLGDEEANSKFGFILEALKYGAPPHGGIAFGFDRIVAILCGEKSIRDVIAFPKSVSAASVMEDAPSIVEKNQLDELGIKIIEKK